MLRLRFTQEADTVLEFFEDGIKKVVTLAKNQWFHLPDVGVVKQLIDKGHLITEAAKVVDEVKKEETAVVAEVVPEVIAPVVEEVKTLVKPFEFIAQAGKQKWEL